MVDCQSKLGELLNGHAIGDAGTILACAQVIDGLSDAALTALTALIVKAKAVNALFPADTPASLKAAVSRGFLSLSSASLIAVQKYGADPAKPNTP